MLQQRKSVRYLCPTLSCHVRYDDTTLLQPELENKPQRYTWVRYAMCVCVVEGVDFCVASWKMYV